MGNNGIRPVATDKNNEFFHDYILVFSSPELKAQVSFKAHVSFSDRLLSVVCPSVCKHFFTFSSSPELLGQFQPNLVQSILG